MAYLCCGCPCKKTTRTPVVSLKERAPVKCFTANTTTARPKNITWMQFMGLDKYRPENWEEPTYLPGQLLDDDLLDRPRLIPERTFVEFSTSRDGSGQHKKHQHVVATQYLVSSPSTLNLQGQASRFQISQNQQGWGSRLETSSNQQGLVSRLETSAKPVQEILQNQQPNHAQEPDGMQTSVHGSAPRPMLWKEMYVNMIKPREQIMSMYNTTAAKHADRNPGGVLNVSPASDDSAERVDVHARRRVTGEERFQAFRERLRQTLKEPRRRPAPKTREWDIATVISDSEEGDEEDEILYSTDQDCGRIASGGDGHESECKSKAVASHQGAHSLSEEDQKHQSLAAYTPESHPAAGKSSTQTTNSSASCAEPVKNISRETSSDDFEEVIILPEEVAKPSKPVNVLKPTKARRRNILRNVFSRKRSYRVHPSVAVEEPSEGGACTDRSNSGNSSKDRTAPSSPAAESQDKAHPGVNMAPDAVQRAVTKDPPRVAREPPRFRWSPEGLFRPRFNAFEKPSRDE